MFIAEYNATAGKHVSIVPDEVWAKLRAHSWPGNVRELRNVVERCVMFSEDERFPAQWLQLPQGREPDSDRSPDLQGEWLRLPLDGSISLDDMEKYIIRKALEREQYNISAAARALGTTRQTLRYRIDKYGLKAGS